MQSFVSFLFGGDAAPAEATRQQQTDGNGDRDRDGQPAAASPAAAKKDAGPESEHLTCAAVEQEKEEEEWTCTGIISQKLNWSEPGGPYVLTTHRFQKTGSSETKTEDTYIEIVPGTSLTHEKHFSGTTATPGTRHKEFKFRKWDGTVLTVRPGRCSIAASGGVIGRGGGNQMVVGGTSSVNFNGTGTERTYEKFYQPSGGFTTFGGTIINSCTSTSTNQFIQIGGSHNTYYNSDTDAVVRQGRITAVDGVRAGAEAERHGMLAVDEGARIMTDADRIVADAERTIADAERMVRNMRW